MDSEVFRARTLDITWPVAEGALGMEAALDRICAESDIDRKSTRLNSSH